MGLRSLTHPTISAITTNCLAANHSCRLTLHTDDQDDAWTVRNEMVKQSSQNNNCSISTRSRQYSVGPNSCLTGAKIARLCLLCAVLAGCRVTTPQPNLHCGAHYFPPIIPNFHALIFGHKSPTPVIVGPQPSSVVIPHSGNPQAVAGGVGLYGG